MFVDSYGVLHFTVTSFPIADFGYSCCGYSRLFYFVGAGDDGNRCSQWSYSGSFDKGF